MDADEFRQRGKEMVDYVADYLENIRKRRPLPDVQPGYLRPLIPSEAPENPEKWEDVFQDIERVIMPGTTHWHSPHFHSYFPAANSYPAICADILSNGIACIGFSWASSPACTELEVVMMDWLAKIVHLPEEFMSGGKGGGVIQGSASEATLLALFAARNKAIQKIRQANPNWTDDHVKGHVSKFVCYCSDQAHSSVERACLLGAVKCRKVVSDGDERMRGEALERAIMEDKRKGLIPFYCVATLGTTPTCAFDALTELGPICRREKLWLHVDAAYAGSSFVCPEHRPLLAGIEYADSYIFSPHKWMLVNFECCAMWFKDTFHMVDNFRVNPVYLKHEHQDVAPDFRHWQIPMGRGFRSLKLWFVLRLYGVEGIRAYIRKHITLAHEFEKLVLADDAFEVTHKVTMGLVCFRLKSESNGVTTELLKRINKDGRIHMVSSESKGVYFLRFAVCAESCQHKDIVFAWDVIKELAQDLIKRV